MTNFRATAETAASPVEAVAAAARTLFSVLHPGESWDELSGLAEQKETPALARQAVFMRAARFGLEAYARFAGGVRHRNPLSLRERQLVAQVWMSVVTEPESFPLRHAGKQVGVHLARYNEDLARTAASGGRGAVAAMIRDYSRVMARITEAAGNGG